MKDINAVRARLADTHDVPGALAAAWDTFEFLRITAGDCADPESSAYAAFMFASVSATEARDAVGFAPSMPAGACVPGGDGEPRDGDMRVTTQTLAELAALLFSRLNADAGHAVLPGDQGAFERAAGQAELIRGLLAEGG